VIVVIGRHGVARNSGRRERRSHGRQETDRLQRRVNPKRNLAVKTPGSQTGFLRALPRADDGNRLFFPEDTDWVEGGDLVGTVYGHVGIFARRQRWRQRRQQQIEIGDPAHGVGR
jgi:hypothetical protein